MPRSPVVLFLAVVLMAGCRSTGPRSPGDGWGYIGPDDRLRSPYHPKERVRQFADDPARRQTGVMSEALQRKFQEDIDAWRKLRIEAFERTTASCAETTKESVEPGVGFGYSDRFVACLRAQGWIRGGDPL